MGVAQWVPCVQVTFGVTVALLVVLFCCRGWSTISFTCHPFGCVLVVESVMSVSLETTTMGFRELLARIATFFCDKLSFCCHGCCVASVDWESLYVAVLCFAHVNQPRRSNKQPFDPTSQTFCV
jgi:hypothetical protein